MDAAAQVLHRLERIEALDVHGAPRSRLLDELRALVGEAEAWARLGVGGRPGDEAADLREGVEGMR